MVKIRIISWNFCFNYIYIYMSMYGYKLYFFFFFLLWVSVKKKWNHDLEDRLEWGNDCSRWPFELKDTVPRMKGSWLQDLITKTQLNTESREPMVHAGDWLPHPPSSAPSSLLLQGLEILKLHFPGLIAAGFQVGFSFHSSEAMVD